MSEIENLISKEEKFVQIQLQSIGTIQGRQPALRQVLKTIDAHIADGLKAKMIEDNRMV